MKLFFAALFLLFSFIFANAQSEQAPIQEKEFKYKDWTLKTVKDGSEVNLRQFVADKKLVLVVYFAPWCGNWKHEAPFVQKMYEKYKSKGLEIIGVGEYGSLDEMKTTLNFFKITFPVVYESEKSEARDKTTHYEYRQKTGDTRKWGSPWNLFVEPINIEKKGDTLLKKASIANGELIEVEAEKFIRTKLGLPAEQAKASNPKKEIEACEGEKKTAEFKVP
jgi:thiol-disulfide isomerase/thioredoxin